MADRPRRFGRSRYPARVRIREILPGIFHWTAVHPAIRTEVSCHYVEPARMLLDPLVPEEGLAWFERRGPLDGGGTGGPRLTCEGEVPLLDVLRAVAEGLHDADGEAAIIQRCHDAVQPVPAPRVQLDAEKTDPAARREGRTRRVAGRWQRVDAQ